MGRRGGLRFGYIIYRCSFGFKVLGFAGGCFWIFKKIILGKGVRVVVCFFRIFLFYWLGEKGLLDSGGGGGLFLTFGFKHIFFRFWVLGSRGGCLWIFF